MSLARYFQGKALHMAVSEFIRKDLSYQTAPMYLAEATIYALPVLAAAAAQLCAENCDSIEVSTHAVRRRL